MPSELPPAFRGGPFVSCRENWYSGASLNVRSSQESLEKSQNETSPHQLVTQNTFGFGLVSAQVQVVMVCSHCGLFFPERMKRLRRSGSDKICSLLTRG